MTTSREGITMAKTTLTYGQFVDAMQEVAKGVGHAEVLFEEWYELATEAQWREYRQLPLDEGKMLNFTDDMVSSFRRLIGGTCTDQLYAQRINDGHAFLQAIHQKCLELGIQVDMKDIDMPLSPSDAIIMAKSNFQ